MFEVEAERLGDVGKTDKGFIAQYLVELNDSKHVIKVYGKTADLLPDIGKIKIKNDFFFATQ